MLTMPSFKKSLIVEQFQGNYLKTPGVSARKKQAQIAAFVLTVFYLTTL